MRKIENKKDWEDFVADVEYNLGEVESYMTGAFAVSQDGDDWNGHFYTEFDTDNDGYFINDFSINPAESSEWETPEQFFDGLIGNYSFPFYICDTGANYSWL